jgi:hypothetical protein
MPTSKKSGKVRVDIQAAPLLAAISNANDDVISKHLSKIPKDARCITSALTVVEIELLNAHYGAKLNEVDDVVVAAVVSIQVARCKLFDKALGTVVVALIVDQILEPAAFPEMRLRCGSQLGGPSRL